MFVYVLIFYSICKLQSIYTYISHIIIEILEFIVEYYIRIDLHLPHRSSGLLCVHGAVFPQARPRLR